MGLVLAPEEENYFLNLAVIAGTLLGLAFLALTMFMPDLIKRYQGVALPVFRDRDSFNPLAAGIGPPDSLKDHELLDGDPLVVFVAYSVAVTWILFLLPLTIGLTAALAGVRLGILATEMAGLTAALIRSFQTRNAKIRELKPYVTVEERWWPLLGGVVIFVYATAAAVVFVAALPWLSVFVNRVFVEWGLGMTNEYMALLTMKVVCVSALILGTYTLNKDIFIFFKTIAAEGMRQRWLDSFVQGEYRTLLQRVADLEEHIDLPDRFRQAWNDGYPEIISTHSALRNPEVARRLWREIVNRGQGTASWMLDIPRIAEWAAAVRRSLDDNYPISEIRIHF